MSTFQYKFNFMNLSSYSWDISKWSFLSKLKAVDSNNFYFLFDLFSFILFLELELELKW